MHTHTREWALGCVICSRVSKFSVCNYEIWLFKFLYHLPLITFNSPLPCSTIPPTPNFSFSFRCAFKKWCITHILLFVCKLGALSVALYTGPAATNFLGSHTKRVMGRKVSFALYTHIRCIYVCECVGVQWLDRTKWEWPEWQPILSTYHFKEEKNEQ